LVGTAWQAKKPLTTLPSHLPCSAMSWCHRRRRSSLISSSFAIFRSRRVWRANWKLPRRDREQMWVSPRKSKVSGLVSPRPARSDAAFGAPPPRSRARPPSRRAIPAAANAGRVVVNGGWYYIDRMLTPASSASIKGGMGMIPNSAPCRSRPRIGCPGGVRCRRGRRSAVMGRDGALAVVIRPPDAMTRPGGTVPVRPR
jgi:hypothetical protein